MTARFTVQSRAWQARLARSCAAQPEVIYDSLPAGANNFRPCRLERISGTVDEWSGIAEGGARYRMTCVREAPSPMNKPVKYAAELHHVREVTLTGSANIAFWAERLKREGLSVVEQEGKARIMIIAAEGKYMGVRFREFSVSVLASRDDGGERQAAAYLVQAFNSNRFF